MGQISRTTPGHPYERDLFEVESLEDPYFLKDPNLQLETENNFRGENIQAGHGDHITVSIQEMIEVNIDELQE